MRMIFRITIVMVTVMMLLNADYILSSATQQINIPKKQISYVDLTPSTKKEINCLADNIYFEARGENEDGKKAIAYTTLNRLEDGRWSSTICGVVKQKIKGSCQFSWMCDRSLRKHRKDARLYEECKNVAVMVYLNYDQKQNDVTRGATFYHAEYVRPNWSNLKYLKKIGKHLFYRT